jgi:hypothetical protein
VLSSSQSPNQTRAADGSGEEKLSGGMRVREVGHNLKARVEPGEKILIWIRRNPLKSLESDELNQMNPSIFAWISLAALGFAWIYLGRFRR